MPRENHKEIAEKNGRSLGSVLGGEKWVCSGSWISQSITPAHSFTNIFFEISSRMIGVIVSRDWFSQDLGVEIVNFVRSASDLNSQTAFRLLENLRSNVSEFDCVGLAGPDSHDHLRTKDASLHSRTFWAFPAYRCEFSGRETARELYTMTSTSGLVTVVDWKRKPQPKLLLRYSIPGVSSGSANGDLGLADLDSLEWQVEEIGRVGEGRIDIKNFREQTVRVLCRRGEFSLLDSHSGRSWSFLSTTNLKAWLLAFLHDTEPGGGAV